MDRCIINSQNKIHNLFAKNFTSQPYPPRKLEINAAVQRKCILRNVADFPYI